MPNKTPENTTDTITRSVVMQILPALENGGVERGTIDIAKALLKTDIEPIVLSKGGVLTYQLKEAGVRHITLDVSTKNPFKIYFNINKIAKIITENNVNIVHVRSRAPMWSAYFACKKTKTKLVATIHGPYSLNLLTKKPSYLKKLYNSIMLKADQVITVSNFMKNFLCENYLQNAKVAPEDIKVIHRGADMNYFDGRNMSKNRIIDMNKKWNLPDDKKIILMPARFTSWKGHEFLIDALSRVRSDNFLCIMVGSDHGHKVFRKKIEEKITKLNLEGKVKMVGICKDMPTAYAIANLVVCPSVRPEAFGRIPIEAQASNRIIIATKIGGALETVIDGKTGYLVDLNDANGFAELIDNALDMPEDKVSEMGAAGRKNVEEHFSNDKMCHDTIEIYSKMINAS